MLVHCDIESRLMPFIHYHSYGSGVWVLKLRFTVLPLLLILSHSWSSIQLLYFDDPLWPSCILQLWPLFVTFVHVWIHILSKHLASFFFFLMTLATLVPVHLKQTNKKNPPPQKKKKNQNLCNFDFFFFFFKCRLYFCRVVFQFAQLGLLNCSIDFAEYNLDWLLVWWPKIVPSLIFNLLSLVPHL